MFTLPQMGSLTSNEVGRIAQYGMGKEAKKGRKNKVQRAYQN